MEELDWITSYISSTVDLRDCERGDILISRHDAILVYMNPLDSICDYMDHSVEYIWIPPKSRRKPQTMGSGSRTHDGYVL